MSDAEAVVPTNGSPAAEETQAPAAAPAPIFGAASTFGAGTGFGGFSGVAPKAEGEGEEETGDDAAPEEECAAEFQPIVQLDEVAVSTGEEDEENMLDIKCKLYRYDNESQEWKERGVGQAKILRHKANKRSRFIMRQDKTLKIRGNHVVIPGTKVQEHSGNEKAMVFSCVDFADEVQRPELFCIRFASPERAQEFKKAYEAAAEENAPLLEAASEGEGEEGSEEGSEGSEGEAPEPSDADKAADELAKTTVTDEVKAEGEAAA